MGGKGRVRRLELCMDCFRAKDREEVTSSRSQQTSGALDNVDCVHHCSVLGADNKETCKGAKLGR